MDTFKNRRKWFTLNVSPLSGMVSKMRLLLAVLFCSVMLPSAYAEKLPAPTGKPVLTISGKIGNMNVGDKAVLISQCWKTGDEDDRNHHPLVHRQGSF